MVLMYCSSGGETAKWNSHFFPLRSHKNLSLDYYYILFCVMWFSFLWTFFSFRSLAHARQLTHRPDRVWRSTHQPNMDNVVVNSLNRFVEGCHPIHMSFCIWNDTYWSLYHGIVSFEPTKCRMLFRFWSIHSFVQSSCNGYFDET